MCTLSHHHHLSSPQHTISLCAAEGCANKVLCMTDRSTSQDPSTWSWSDQIQRAPECLCPHIPAHNIANQKPPQRLQQLPVMWVQVKKTQRKTRQELRQEVTAQTPDLFSKHFF